MPVRCRTLSPAVLVDLHLMRNHAYANDDIPRAGQLVSSATGWRSAVI
jgi:hypothetical protein